MHGNGCSSECLVCLCSLLIVWHNLVYIYKYLQTCIFIYMLMHISKIYFLFQQCQSRTFLTIKQGMSQDFWKLLDTLICTLSFSFVMSIVMLFCSSCWLWGVCWLQKDYSVWDKVFPTLRIYPLTYILYFCFLIRTLFLLFMTRKRIKEIAGSVNFQLWQNLEAPSNEIITLRRASSVLGSAAWQHILTCSKRCSPEQELLPLSWIYLTKECWSECYRVIHYMAFRFNQVSLTRFVSKQYFNFKIQLCHIPGNCSHWFLRCGSSLVVWRKLRDGIPSFLIVSWLHIARNLQKSQD